uniref:Homing endonuclease LAGLIDADG domain-containing protein n=1 Tax=Candida labiduridarum TaxID=434042 RepID=S5TNX9_9ASCO|nr:hypothetical protein [Candida labiduridarum]AGS44490.1 hypothetical protein [Candida labiduridarum]
MMKINKRNIMNNVNNITTNNRKPKKGKMIWIYDIINMKLLNEYNSITECSRRINISRNTITKYLNNNKIYKYKYLFSYKLLNNNELNKYNINISDNVKEIIIGELLGDGHINLSPNNKSARLEWTFSSKSLNYVNYLKFNKLKSLCNDTLPSPYPKDNPIQYWFSTKYRPDILDLHKLWYKYDYINNKYIKILPEYLNISPISLAHWLMGDGTYTSSIILCSDTFSKDEVIKLINYLDKQYNIKSTILVIKYINNNKLITRYRVRVRANSTHKFILLVKKHLLPEFYYKLGLN